MSKVNLFSILDVKSGMYGPVMSFVNDKTAIRAFQEMCISRDNNSLIALYPTDYVLSHIGIYDQDTGLIDPCSPRIVVSGQEATTLALVELERRRELKAKLDGNINASSDSSYMYDPNLNEASSAS